jgi:hypothetical protein
MAKLVDTIDPSDSLSWKYKHEGEQRYMEANDWLIAHGVQPTYDQEQQHTNSEDSQQILALAHGGIHLLSGQARTRFELFLPDNVSLNRDRWSIHSS